jgi:uncharacterized peroxidase-related enzyme
VRALCDFAIQVTEEPASITQADIDTLRGFGWTDEAIHDAIQVISFFNYINRVAESVGIDPEPEWGA